MSWWAAQVYSNREYDTERELIATGILKEEDILIPRHKVFKLTNDKDEVTKKTEMAFPGYILLNLTSIEKTPSMERLSNHVKLLGKITEEEMSIIHSYELEGTAVNVTMNDKIIVTRGPFAGVKGMITSVEANGFLKCTLTFQGNQIQTNLNSKIVERLT